VEFESFTGGGGDADADAQEDQDEAARVARLTDRLARSARAGKNVGNLTIARYLEWKEHGWYDLFGSRLRGHAGITREQVFRSGLLSDREDNSDTSDEDFAEDSEDEHNSGGDGLDGSHESGPDSDIEVINQRLPTTSSTKKPATKVTKKQDSKTAATPTSKSKSAKSSTASVPLCRQPGVPIPAHKPRTSKSHSSGLDTYLEKSAEALDVLNAQQARKVELQEKKLAHDRENDRVDRAIAILKDPSLDERIRERAQQIVDAYFSV